MTKEVGALWKVNNPKEKSPILTGSVEQVTGCPIQVSIFKNERKIKPNQPDYNIVLSPSIKRPLKKLTSSQEKSSDDLF